MKHLHKLIQDIQLRCSCASKVPYTDDLGPRLRSLTSVEKFLIADFIYTQEYDIGTGRILKLLQELGIISVQHYVTKIEDTSLLLNIYNDFLENQPTLFIELIKGATQKNHPNSIQLKELFDTFLEDFVQNLQGLKCNPFKAVFDILDHQSGQYLNETLLSTFMTSGNEAKTVQNALNEHHLWEAEEKNEIQRVIIKDCVLQMGSIDTLLSFIHRFVLERKGSNINWQIYCQILRSLARIYGLKILPLYRKMLSEDIKIFIKDKNEFLFYLTILTIRQLSLSAPNEFNYGEWYKRNIGEMSYTITKEEFLYVMKVLTKMVEHEGNEKFIKTHINTRIQAPPMCNEVVFTYKAILRSRLESLGKKTEVIELDL